jgi:hypothetical protein
MKNKGGRFVELFDYHSGSQQGHIRIPKGKQGRGWVSFAGELRRFFLGGSLKPTKAVGSVLVKDKVVAVNLGRNLGHKSYSSMTVSRELGGAFIKSAKFTLNGRRSVFECLLFGVHWVMPKRVVDLLASWQGSFRRHKHGGIWKYVPHCLLWCIWRERNARSFEGCESSVVDLKLRILKTLAGWVSATGCFPYSELADFLDHCSFGT